jgi:hypothetical protein
MVSAIARGQEPETGQMNWWRDVELLYPACRGWRAGGAAMTIEDPLGQSSDRLLVASDLRLRGPRGALVRAGHLCIGAPGRAAAAAEPRAAVSAALAELHSVFSAYDPVTAAAYISDTLWGSPIGGGREAALGSGGR